jgi:hypothetical protein
MGIPQFKRHLEPYAERAFIEPGNVVLDGPALAYHILNLCSRTRRKSSPLEQPSYQLLGKTAVEWLDRLQACGLSVYIQSNQAPYVSQARMDLRANHVFEARPSISMVICLTRNGLNGFNDSSNPHEI